MFTGIITEIGKVKSLKDRQLTVAAPDSAGELRPGDSVSVNGVCLTVASLVRDGFSADLLAETASRTNLGKVRIGDSVNLELALRAGERLGGHLVSGHVDGIGRIRKTFKKGRDRIMEITVSGKIIKYVRSKGSVAIDGVSLTVVRVFSNSFTVHLIPYTATHTILGGKHPGNILNIEVDMLARYAVAEYGDSRHNKNKGCCS